MPLVQTRGAASAQGFGEFAQATAVNYIEDVFSTFLYTGNGSNQTITNGIDLSTKGGMVWTKSRSASGEHNIVCNDVGLGKWLVTNTTQTTQSFAPNGYAVPVFNTTGVTLSDSADQATSSVTYASWTFRKQPKFFDVVTYTGNGATSQAISHNLQSVPGVIIVKRLNAISDWLTGALFTAGDYTRLKLNGTNVGTLETGYTDGFYSQPTSSSFAVNSSTWNVNGGTYVAYLFASNAGGFGLTGTDNVISCGSFTTDGSGNATVSLGYEPQWLLFKQTNGADNWRGFDTMRGWSMTENNFLFPNTSGAETASSGWGNPTATGFTIGSANASASYIYIAIRRGPMKVPTVGTSVFSPIAYTGNSTSNTTVQNLTTNFSGDTTIIQQRSSGNNPLVFDKLRGSTQGLYTSLTLAEENISTARPGQSVGFNNTQTVLTGQFTTQGNYNYSGDTFVSWNFKRAPSFFDEVCYTGTGVARTVTHNLAAVPELMIVKRRNDVREWNVYASPLGATKFMFLNTQDAVQTDTMWNDTAPTSSVFSVGTYQGVNASGSIYVAYLFATCAGVSKVGSYTGNGTTQTIDCGFGAGGARFVLLKRTDAAGGWYVYDTARGMTVLTDPYLLLNSTAAEVATLGSVTTVSTGFALNSAILAAINVNAGSYIFLAIA